MKLEEFTDSISDEDRIARMNKCLDEMNELADTILEQNNLTPQKVSNESTRNRKQNT